MYRLSPSGTYTILHEFSGGADGAYPIASPIEATDGNLYGLTLGSFAPPAATLYSYRPQSGTFTTIYTFDVLHGQYATDLIQGTDGNLYGAAVWGGSNSCGTIFKLTTAGVPLWSYSFSCVTGGYNPQMLLQAADGNFYGIAENGGDCMFCGTIFKVDAEGNVSTLYSFPPELVHGANPDDMVQATDGNLYGATFGGGQLSDGTLFKISTSGTFSLLYSFDGNTGTAPETQMQHTNGLLYGAAFEGGSSNAGTVYSFDVRLSPFITFVLPVGKAGKPAQILGQRLTGATSVTFNGVAATSFKVVSGTYMTAVVPSGATTGPVVVTTPSGTLTSNKNFTVLK